MNIFFTADFHLNHANVIKYANRPFNSVEQMNQTIIQNWNAIVKPSDIVYFLGDFAFAGKEKIREFRSQLNGDIILIVGNHDRTKKSMTECGFYIPTNVDRRFDHYMICEKILNVSLEPLLLTHSPYSVQKQDIMDKFHVSFSMWNLHGHVHVPHATTINAEKREINVNVELWDYKPVSLAQIYQIIHQNNYVDYRIME